MIEKLVQTLKEKGCEMGYNGSAWYSLAEIEKFGKQIENESANEPKCEKCGGAIQYDDCMDIEHGGDYDDTVICTYNGHCEKCETEYTWIEEYKYHHRRNLEIINN